MEQSNSMVRGTPKERSCKLKTSEKPSVSSEKLMNGDGAFAMPVMAAAFAPICRKVRFPSEEAATDGFGILIEAGGVETLQDDVYGVMSERQLKLLKDRKVPFEIVND